MRTANTKTVTVLNNYTIEFSERLDINLGQKLFSAARIYPETESKDILVKDSVAPVKLIDPAIAPYAVVLGKNSSTLSPQLFLIEMSVFGTFKRAVHRIDIDPATRDIYIQPEDMSDKDKENIILKIHGSGKSGSESVTKINFSDYLPSVQTISISASNFAKMPETIGYNTKHILPKPGKVSEVKYGNMFEDFVVMHNYNDKKTLSR